MSARMEKLRQHLRDAGIDCVISNQNEIYIDGVIYELSRLVEVLLPPAAVAVGGRRTRRHPEPFYCQRWK